MDPLSKEWGWSGRSVFLFLFAFIFIYIRAYEDLTLIVTRVWIPVVFLIAVFKKGLAIFSRRRFFYDEILQSYFLLFLWSLITVFVVKSIPDYIRYTQLFVGVMMMAIIIKAYVGTIGDIKFFCMGFVFGVIFMIGDLFVKGELSTSIDGLNEHQRASGIAGNSNTLGSIILLASVLSVLIRRVFGMINGLYIVINLVFVFALIQTASRSSLFGFIMVHSLVLLYNFGSIRASTKLIFAFLGMSSLIIFFPILESVVDGFLDQTFIGHRIQREAGKSDQLRYAVLMDGLKMIQNNPIFGVGSGNFQNNTNLKLYSHNDLIEITATTGIIGLLLYISFLRKIWRITARIRSNYGGSVRQFSVITYVFFLCFLVQGLFKPLFIDIYYMTILFLLVIGSRIFIDSPKTVRI